MQDNEITPELGPVANVYLFPNGNVATFNHRGHQIAELQGVYSKELHDKIKMYADENTEWNGFD